MRIISLILLECFLFTTLPLDWAWAGERFPSAVGRRFSPCPGSSLLRPKSAAFDPTLRQAISGTSARDGGEHTVSPLAKSPQFHSSYVLLGRGLPTEILGGKIEIFKGVQAVDARGYLVPHKPPTSPYTLFSQLLNKDEEPYRKTRELFASLARHHHFRFARGMKTLLRRESRERVLVHEALADPAHAPPEEIFWEFWVTLLRSSAIRHDPELIGSSAIGFTPQVFGLLGEMGRLLLIEKPKREKLKEYLEQLSDKGVISVDKDFLNRYMATVDEIERRFARNFIDLSRGTRQIYTNFALSLAIPPIVRLLNPKGWPEEALSDVNIPQDFRIHLSTALKRLRRAEEYQRVVRTINGEGDPEVPETAIIGDIKGDARALNLMLQRAVERRVDKIILMGDLFGKSRGRSLGGGSPLVVHDMLREFEKKFEGRGVYIFQPDDLVFLFTMMGYPGLDGAWDSVYGGEAFLEARNKEIRYYNDEVIRQEEGEETKLIPELDLHNFREDPRLREIAEEWIKMRFYTYHLDEFGVLYVGGSLPGALGGGKEVSFSDWDRKEELIRTTDTFKANVFHDLMNVELSPVMAAGWKEDSQKLNLEEFLPSIQVDGEGGHEVTAIMTGAPNFNIQNRSMGTDFDDPVAKGGAGIALRFIGRDGVQVDRFVDGEWVTQTEESPKSFLERVQANHTRRIKIVSEDLAREDKKVLSLLTRRDISEENEILRWVRQIQNDVQRGAKISELVEGPLMKVAEEVLYIGGKMPNREQLAQVLGIEVFHGNILYNEETKETVLLVGQEGIGRSYITWLLVGAKDPMTGRRLYPGWTLMSHELTRLFAIGGKIFGGTRPLRELRPEWRELYYLDKEGEVKKTGILPKEAVVKISRIILLTDEEITMVARSRMKELFKKGGKTLHGEKVEQILAIQEKASQIPSDALKEALYKVHIEKFHVGVTRDIRSLRLPRIAAIIDADVGQKWWGSRWGAWFLAHFPPGSKLSQVLKELRHEREFPAAGLSKREQKVGRGEGKGASDGGEKRVEAIVPVTNPLGLHARPAGMIAKVVNASKSKVAIMHVKTGEVANAKNVMELMILAAEEGDELKIMVEGENAEEILELIKAELRIEYTPEEEGTQDGHRKILLEEALSTDKKRSILPMVFQDINGLVEIPTLFHLTQKGLFGTEERDYGLFGEGEQEVALRHIAEIFNPEKPEKNMGNLYGAMRVMALQGWVRVKGVDEGTTYTLTPQGKVAVTMAKGGYLPEELIQAIERFREYYPHYFRGPPPRKQSEIKKREEALREYRKLVDLSIKGWYLPEASHYVSTGLLKGEELYIAERVTEQIRSYLTGMIRSPTLAAIGFGLYRHHENQITRIGPSVLEKFKKDSTLNLEQLGKRYNRDFLDVAFDLLESQKFLTRDGEKGEVIRLTPLGRALLSKFGSYGVPVAYLKSYQLLHEILWGDPDPWGISDDNHIHRLLDILGSDRAHEAYLESLKARDKKIFDLPIEEQPIGIATTGAGAGHLVVERVKSIVENTEGGKHLKTHPLVAIASDYNEDSLDTLRGTLTKELRDLEGVFFKVLWGDATDPDEFAAAIKKLEIPEVGPLEAKDFYHTQEFIPHERNLKLSIDDPTHGREKAMEIIREQIGKVDRGALWEALKASGERDLPEKDNFLRKNVVDDETVVALVVQQLTTSGSSKGRLVPSVVLFADLIQFFKRWAPYARHGLSLLELHTPRTEEMEEEIPNDPNVRMKVESVAAVSYWGTHYLSAQWIIPFQDHRLAAVLAGLDLKETEVWPKPQSGLPVGVSLAIYQEKETARDGGEKKIEGTFVVRNLLGLHLRVLTDIVKVARRFDGTQIRLMNVTGKSGAANARSILSLMMLAAERGHAVRLTVEGEGAEEAFAAVKFLITQKDDGTVQDGGRRDALEESGPSPAFERGRSPLQRDLVPTRLRPVPRVSPRERLVEQAI